MGIKRQKLCSLYSWRKAKKRALLNPSLLPKMIKIKNGCWLWHRTKNIGGYGIIKINGKSIIVATPLWKQIIVMSFSA